VEGVECRSESVLFLSPAKRVGVTLALGLMWLWALCLQIGGVMGRNWSGLELELEFREMDRPFLGLFFRSDGIWVGCVE
jgi:hypothetical protein